MTKQNAVITAGAVLQFEPRQNEDPLTARLALFPQRQLAIKGAEAQTGETVGDEADTLNTGKIV